MDEYTLNEIEKFIEKRVEKLKARINIYEKTDTRYIVYKNLIMELQTIKEQIKAKKNIVKNGNVKLKNTKKIYDKEMEIEELCKHQNKD